MIPDRDDFQPGAPAVNPVNGWVHFPDQQGGRVVIIEGTTIVAEPIVTNESASQPFEITIVDSMQGYNFVTLHEADMSEHFKFVGFDSTDPFSPTYHDIRWGNTATGKPYAISLGPPPQQDLSFLFMTLANDPRKTDEDPPNPNLLLVSLYSITNPTNIFFTNVFTTVGNFAEAGLIYHARSNQLLGTYGGFAYDDSNGDETACRSSDRGGTYALQLSKFETVFDFLPGVVVGNPPLTSSNLDWRNPFEIAVNPNNSKIYITDRCWNEFPEGEQPGGGAVLISGYLR